MVPWAHESASLGRPWGRMGEPQAPAVIVGEAVPGGRQRKRRHRGRVRTLLQGGQWSPALRQWETVTRGSLFGPGRSGRGGPHWLRVPAPRGIDHSWANLGAGVHLAITSGTATLCLGPRWTSGEPSKTLCSRPCSGAFSARGGSHRGPDLQCFFRPRNGQLLPCALLLAGGPEPWLPQPHAWPSAATASAMKVGARMARAPEPAVLTAGLSLSP